MACSTPAAGRDMAWGPFQLHALKKWLLALGVLDLAAGFEMSWELTKPAQPRMEGIVKAVKGAERLVLATDPDREGEAISWHLLQELQVGDHTAAQCKRAAPAAGLGLPARSADGAAVAACGQAGDSPVHALTANSC